MHSDSTYISSLCPIVLWRMEKDSYRERESREKETDFCLLMKVLINYFLLQYPSKSVKSIYGNILTLKLTTCGFNTQTNKHISLLGYADVF